MKTASILAAALASALAFTSARAADITPAETKAIAEEGFIYGLPIVMNYAVMYEYCVDKNSGQYKAPFNQIKNEARVFTYKDTAIITPNSDTPYSLLWLDLRAEPMVLSVPAVEKSRYYSVSSATATPSTTATSAAAPPAPRRAITWWSARTGKARRPPASRRYSVPPRSSRWRRIALSSSTPADMPNVVKVQAGYKAQPLSAYLKQPAPPAAPAINFPKIDKESAKTNFFEYLDFALQFAPAGPEEKAIRAKLALLGIGSGQELLDFKDLSPEDKAAIAAGMKEGDEKIEELSQPPAEDHQRLECRLDLRRPRLLQWRLAASAPPQRQAGIYGNDAVEAMYPMTKTLPNGEPLDGSKHNYTLTFAAGQLPPVNAFWSVTMYDGKTQLLIKNPINRYLINSPMLPDMKKNADGSLTIYIQNESPGTDKESNWLPAPDGPIYLVMRLYWPKETPPSILPPGKGTWKPPAIVKVK